MHNAAPCEANQSRYRLAKRRRPKARPGFQSLEGSANLPEPGVIAADIVEALEAALSQFAAIVADLKR